MLQTLAREFSGADKTSPKRWVLVPPAVTPPSQTSPPSPSPQIGQKRVTDPDALPNDRTGQTPLTSTLQPPTPPPPTAQQRPQRSTSSSIYPRTRLPSLTLTSALKPYYRSCCIESLKHVTKKMALAFARAKHGCSSSRITFLPTKRMRS